MVLFFGIKLSTSQVTVNKKVNKKQGNSEQVTKIKEKRHQIVELNLFLH
jgi:hypothetical protein